jgi:hypothetical protein
MLIIIQGLGTLIIGVATFALMPPSPTQTANWIRGRKGWFTERLVTMIRLDSMNYS